MANETENLIETQNLCFEYNADDEETENIPVLHNVNLSIRAGEFVAVLGHNGSGKSTFAKHINAILQPTSGTFIVDNIDTSNDDMIFEIRKEVGMVFQNPDNQIVATVVEEDVAFALENLGVEPSEIRKRVDSALKTVDMYHYREHAPHQLSGGQKQRVAIAGIIAMNPKCIVLDEPTAML
ncbi:MAG: ATP-binding cassette domain-containing protein, partial [Oscillospiraceae bacterium]